MWRLWIIPQFPVALAVGQKTDCRIETQSAIIRSNFNTLPLSIWLQYLRRNSHWQSCLSIFQSLNDDEMDQQAKPDHCWIPWTEVTRRVDYCEQESFWRHEIGECVSVGSSKQRIFRKDRWIRWTLMDIDGHWWTLMDIDGHWWTWDSWVFRDRNTKSAKSWAFLHENVRISQEFEKNKEFRELNSCCNISKSVPTKESHQSYS
jgi:hypothetical protein